MSEESSTKTNGLSFIARKLTSLASQDSRLQEASSEVRREAKSLSSNLRDKADERLERLIKLRQEGRKPSKDVQNILEKQRLEREHRQSQKAAYQAVAAVATTAEERRVLAMVLASTPWAGGDKKAPKLTEILDALSADGNPEQEVALNRAIWSLAERKVLVVSAGGEVSAFPLPA